jgi:hypothetical protein
VSGLNCRLGQRRRRRRTAADRKQQEYQRAMIEHNALHPVQWSEHIIIPGYSGNSECSRYGRNLHKCLGDFVLADDLVLEVRLMIFGFAAGARTAGQWRRGVSNALCGSGGAPGSLAG